MNYAFKGRLCGFICPECPECPEPFSPTVSNKSMKPTANRAVSLCGWWRQGWLVSCSISRACFPVLTSLFARIDLSNKRLIPLQREDCLF